MDTVVNLQPGVFGPGNVTINNAINFVINLLIVVGILVALGFLIYGGIRWITSGGDKTAVENARNHVVAAIIGLIVVVLAYVIIDIVLKVLGLGGLQTGFQIPTLQQPTVNGPVVR